MAEKDFTIKELRQGFRDIQDSISRFTSAVLAMLQEQDELAHQAAPEGVEVAYGQRD